MRAIVTRPEPQAGQWLRALRERGVDAAALPLIAIEPLADPAPLHAAWAALAERALVMYVSPTAVLQFHAHAPPGARFPPGTLAASPGPGTSRALREAGVAPTQIIEPAADSPRFDSEALWSQLAAHDWQGKRVLIVGGDGGRAWFADTLRAHRADVTVLSVYRRAPPQLDADGAALLADALARPQSHVWLFSSSEAIDRLEELAAAQSSAERLADACAIATHPRIAERARTLGIGRVMASRPGLDDIVTCIQSIRS